MSAGIAAMLGGRASPEAVEVMAGMGLDLSDHETQPLTEPLVRHADVIYTMTRTHREAIVAQWPGGGRADLPALADESDVCDPIGGPPERYQRLQPRQNPRGVGTSPAGTMRRSELMNRA